MPCSFLAQKCALLQASMPIKHSGSWAKCVSTCQHVFALKLLVEYLLALFVDAMYLYDVLCQVNPYCCNLHIGRLYCVVGIRIHHNFGTVMPFKVGATIPLAWTHSGH